MREGIHRAYGTIPTTRSFVRAAFRRSGRLRCVLRIGDRLEPSHVLAVERFLHGQVFHGVIWRGAMPMLFARREPDHVTGPDLLDGATPTLRETAASGYDQGLA